MIYFDTSALMKLIAREAESEDLSGWLAEHRNESHVTSALTCVELSRAARRSTFAGAQARAQRVFDGIDILPIDDAVVHAAQSVGEPQLRSLDAIHLATALHAGLTSMVTYDHRLADAARDAGLTVLAPGASPP